MCVCVGVLLCCVVLCSRVYSGVLVVRSVQEFITTNISIRMDLQVARSTWSIDLSLHFESV